MTWLEAYGSKDEQPTFEQMSAFVHNPLWEDFHAYMQAAYQVEPKYAFSTCSGQPGWNVKYIKAGKSLGTIYPMEGYFIVLAVVGEKERTEFELQMPAMTPYVQALYQQSGALMGAKWMMTEIRGADVLEDVKRIIALRRKPK